ncbi:MAG: hypothetical protein V2I51_19490 [Anderseniella sp.]|jgi:hypothetical protein|nr:hypothetical protein [Anderseniella sp.]
MVFLAHFQPFDRPEQKHAQLLAIEFPRSFRQAGELVTASKKIRWLRRTANAQYPVKVDEVLNGIDTLRTYLLFENFYYKSLSLNLWNTPELLTLARTSSDWRVVYFLALMDADYPEHEPEYDFLLHLMALNSKAISQASRYYEHPVQNIA